VQLLEDSNLNGEVALVSLRNCAWRSEDRKMVAGIGNNVELGDVPPADDEDAATTFEWENISPSIGEQDEFIAESPASRAVSPAIVDNAPDYITQWLMQIQEDGKVEAYTGRNCGDNLVCR
jgi:hypothetical protein